MKHITILLALLLVTSLLNAQTKETRNVSAFTKISFRIPGKLFLTQGNTQKVEIEGNTSALKEIETEVTDGKLVIGHEDNWSFSKTNEKFNVYITVKDIDALSVGGSGSLLGQGKFTADDIDLSVSGSGSMQIDVDASGNMEANVSGSGHMDVKGHCKNYSSDISGSGTVVVALVIVGNADIGISGSGKTEASGSAKKVKTQISGSGRVLAANLETEECNVTMSGSGQVEINVKNSLDANISGSGTVLYKGNPSHVNGHSSGSGHVRKM